MKRRATGEGESTNLAALAGLGSVEFWLNHPAVIDYSVATMGKTALTSEQVKACVREGLEDARRLLPDRGADAREVARRCIETRLGAAAALTLGQVVNATGIILHTNLGRAPINRFIARLAVEIASGYTNLEYDVVRGERTQRLAGLEAALVGLSGAEAAIAVNNCAAALFLILTALAGSPYDERGPGKDDESRGWREPRNEVVISRGELVQIGGGFRIPTILAESGASLVEVGTTNVTTIEDYKRALGPRTAVILKVHSSNFVLRGFTEKPSTYELAALAHESGLPFVEDLGSATLASERILPNRQLLMPQPSLRAGADLVCFSGDKLLGGPQAGIILGGKIYVDRLRRHPVMRTLRLDKWTGALLSSLLWALGGDRDDFLPVVEMMRRDAASDRKLAAKIRRKVMAKKLSLEIVPHTATLGGGSAPGEEIDSFALAVTRTGASPGNIAERLRKHKTPIVGVVKDDRFLLGMRTLLPGDEDVIVSALNSL